VLLGLRQFLLKNYWILCFSLLESDVRIPRQFNCEVEDTRCVLNGVRPRFLTSKASLEIGSALVVDYSYSKKNSRGIVCLIPRQLCCEDMTHNLFYYFFDNSTIILSRLIPLYCSLLIFVFS